MSTTRNGINSEHVRRSRGCSLPHASSARRALSSLDPGRAKVIEQHLFDTPMVEEVLDVARWCDRAADRHVQRRRRKS
jgi:hypothetical protein